MTRKSFMANIRESVMLKVLTGAIFSILLFIFGLLISGARFYPKLEEQGHRLSKLEIGQQEISDGVDSINTAIFNYTILIQKVDTMGAGLLETNERISRINENIERIAEENKEERNRFWIFIEKLVK